MLIGLLLLHLKAAVSEALHYKLRLTRCAIEHDNY